MQRCIYTLFVSLLCSAFVYGQGTQTEYGKNRVQYHKDFDEWSQYESDNFITYWYGEGRLIGQSVVQIAEYDFFSIQRLLEHRINSKIQIIVYTDITDLKQSNIGSEEAFTNTGGQTKIVGNKVFVYFNGDHTHLRRQIREGIASVYLNAMLFGSNLQEIVQNAVMMNLPIWFKEGLVSYVGENWSTELDNQLRDFLMSEEFESFDRFAEENPKLAGHSLWYFIGENFGQSTVSNLLYLTRINRSIESGFLYVLGSTYETTTDSWATFFKERYKTESKTRAAPAPMEIEIKNKRNLPISELKLSPDGTKIAYVANEIGKYRVFIQDVYTGERKTVIKEGFRNAFQATDYNYPLLAWNPNNQDLAIIYERRDIVKLMVYNTITEESTTEELNSQYHRVYSIDYVNPITLVFSATVRGLSDIFLYYTNTRQTERITNDFWDDIDAAFVKVGNRKGILFASNRQDSLIGIAKLDSILPLNTFDLFYYDLEDKSKELVRVTNTPLANERHPVAVDTTHFSYLTDNSGIYNREAGYLEDYIHHYDQIITLEDGTEITLHVDSSLTSLDTTLIDTIVIVPVIKKRAITHKISNYDRSIIEQHTSPRTNRLVELVYRDGRYRAFRRDIKVDTSMTPFYTSFQQIRLGAFHSKKAASRVEPPAPIPSPSNILEENKEIKIDDEPLDLPEEKQDTGKVDIDNYLFQSEFDDDEAPITVVIEEDKKEKLEPSPKEEDSNVRIRVTGTPQSGADGSSSKKEVYRFRPGRITPYRLKFRTDFVTTKLDNSLLFEGMESFAASGPEDFGYPPPGILLKANFKDLFEDYEIEGGIRIPTTFNGAEYFLVFNDKKTRLDKRYALYRRNLRYTEDNPNNPIVPLKTEVNTLIGQYGLRYPLDIFRSLRATFTLRQDRLTDLATDRPSLESPTRREQRIGLRVEYVFDNTLDVALNIKNGTRWKVFGDIVKRFELQLLDDVTFNFGEGYMGVVGVDARHYQRLLKHSVFAARFAGAASFGSERILYYIGGVDNWLFPLQQDQRFNDEIPVPQSGNFAFQALANPVRGFRLNIRNGSNYAVMNTELRVPLFKYFSRRIRSSFFRNFQVIGFFDMGTAWEGFNPFGKDNPLNTTTLVNGDLVNVKVSYFRDPIVAGYGFGVRSMLFGYFIRLDYAWGIETRQVLDPRLYVSLGMDF